MKILVMGQSGSGKSTLAGNLGKIYRIPVLHLDHIFWLPGWQSRSREEMQKIVAQFMDSHTSWIIDGNYTHAEYERRLAEADQIIYLSFNRFSCLYRVWKRYRQYKGRTRADMGDGCTEKLDREFMWWVLYEGRDKKHREAYRSLCVKYKEKLTTIRNQKQLDRYIRRNRNICCRKRSGKR